MSDTAMLPLLKAETPEAALSAWQDRQLKSRGRLAGSLAFVAFSLLAVIVLFDVLLSVVLYGQLHGSGTLPGFFTHPALRWFGTALWYSGLAIHPLAIVIIALMQEQLAPPEEFRAILPQGAVSRVTMQSSRRLAYWYVLWLSALYEILNLSNLMLSTWIMESSRSAPFNLLMISRNNILELFGSLAVFVLTAELLTWLFVLARLSAAWRIGAALLLYLLVQASFMFYTRLVEPQHWFIYRDMLGRVILWIAIPAAIWVWFLNNRIGMRKTD